MKNLYWKIIRGYSAEDYIEINEDELNKAYTCFLLKKDSVFSGGAVRGSEIVAIQPDYHRIMGWNRGYKLNADDYKQLASEGIDRITRDMLYSAKNQLLASGKETKLIE